MLSVLLEAQGFWQNTAFLSWKPLRAWARLAVWGRKWRWSSREFSPSRCLTALLCLSSNPESPPGLLQLFLQQRKGKPGTVGQDDNWRPTEAFGFVLAAKRDWEKWITFYLLCMILSHNLNDSFFFKNCTLVSLVSGLACFSSVVECVSQWLSYCSQSSRPHKVLTLSPAIWHCLTKDTNTSNWIQPLWEILAKSQERQHDVFRISCTRKQSSTRAHSQSAG